MLLSKMRKQTHSKTMRYRNVVGVAVVSVLLLVGSSVAKAVTYGDPVDEPSSTHPEVVPVWVGRTGM